MANEYVAVLDHIQRDISGFIGASIVDIDSGMALAAKSQRPDFDLELASAYNTEMVKAKLNTMRVLNITTNLEDMLLTLGDQLHLIQLLGQNSFIYVAADRPKTNLALLRKTVREAVGSIS